MADLGWVTYCGLYCELCSERGRLPQRAKALMELMTQEGYEHWATDEPGFTEFWAFLKRLSDPDGGCPGCRSGGGPPFCGIRKCARAREVAVCPLCDDYPCHRIEMLAQGYPTLLADGRRMQAVGIETWIAEQEKRARTGFAYVDIRYYPYSVPED
jgi:hypothetical protein